MQRVSTHEITIRTLELLEQLTDALIEAHYWSATPPSEIAMVDRSPFCCESMAFESWLQFIFLPKMYELIAAKQPLPDNIAIAPMAEQVWGASHKAKEVIQILAAIDSLLQGHRFSILD